MLCFQHIVSPTVGDAPKGVLMQMILLADLFLLLWRGVTYILSETYPMHRLPERTKKGFRWNLKS